MKRYIQGLTRGATAHLPKLLYERLDDLDIDFAVLYPSRGLTTMSIRDTELRQVACRALNAFNAEVYFPYADRMTPVAQIPMHSPEEALAELDHAVGGLGYEAIMINGLVHRPIGEAVRSDRGVPNWGSGSGERIASLGLDSAYDYDPVWRRCVELGVAPASHTPGMGWGSRRSVSNYIYNHIGSFGASMEALCKSLFIGGVTRRFPELGFGLLEGGVGWACSLFADLVSHWEKRNRDTIHQLDPAPSRSLTSSPRASGSGSCRSRTGTTCSTWGRRSAYVASVFAARQMVPARRGLIANISSSGAARYAWHVAYGVGKCALDRLTADTAHELRPHGVAVVSLWPGLVLTERIQANRKQMPALARVKAESQCFTGRAVAALAGDPDRMRHSGRAIASRELALLYGFTDVDGSLPDGQLEHRSVD